MSSNEKMWKKYKYERKNNFKRHITALDKAEKHYNNRLLDIKKQKEELQEEADTVDKKCLTALNNYDWLIEKGKIRLNGKVAEAIVNRNVSHIIGLFSGFTSVTHSSYSLKLTSQWWCDLWFVNVLDLIDNNGNLKRQDLYNLLDTTKDMDEDSIKEELGMFLLRLV